MGLGVRVRVKVVWLGYLLLLLLPDRRGFVVCPNSQRQTRACCRAGMRERVRVRVKVKVKVRVRVIGEGEGEGLLGRRVRASQGEGGWVGVKG